MSRDKDYDEYCLKAGIENRNTSTVRLGDLEHMNFQELESMVLKHEQQIKDIAAHLLELKRLVTPPMIMDDDDLNNVRYKANYRYETKWVGLTDDEKHDCYLKIDVWSRCVEAIEAKLKEKNT